jgi:HEAT repeat protein
MASDADMLRLAVVRVGKIRAEGIPADVANRVMELFSHPDSRVRVEAVRAVGLHWCLESAAKLIAGLVLSDDDWHVRLSAISALGRIGREHCEVRPIVNRSLATLVLGERFADEKISREEYVKLDPDLPKRFADFSFDRTWTEQLAREPSG